MSIGKIGINSSRRVHRNTDRRACRSTSTDPACPTCESCINVKPDAGPVVTINGNDWPTWMELEITGSAQCTGCKVNNLIDGESSPANDRYIEAAAPNNVNKLYLLKFQEYQDEDIFGTLITKVQYHCTEPTAANLIGHTRHSASGCASPIASDVKAIAGITFQFLVSTNKITGMVVGAGLALNSEHPTAVSGGTTVIYPRWASLYHTKFYSGGLSTAPTAYNETGTDPTSCTGTRIGYGGSYIINAATNCATIGSVGTTYASGETNFAAAGGCSTGATPGWDGILTRVGSTNVWTSAGGTTDGKTLSAKLERVGSGGVCWRYEIYCGASPGTGTIWKGERAGGRYPLGPINRVSGSDTTPAIWIT